MTVPFAVNPLLTGRIVARVGPRAPVLAGLGLLTAAGLLLGGGVLAGASYPSLLAGLVCAGFGVSFALPALVAAVVTAAPEGMAGAAGGAPQRHPAGGRHAGGRDFGRLRHDGSGR